MQKVVLDYSLMISTHTPLAGRDGIGQTFTDAIGISTHTPLAGRDPML